MLTVKDISQQKKFEAAFIADNSRLELAMEAGKIAWWEMETPTGNITCDNRKTAMLGFSPENFTHYTHYTALVHPEDVERTMEAMRQHIYGTAKKYEAEYRIRTASGTYIWTLDMGSITKRDEQGKPLVVAGLVIDITERKLQEAIKGDALHRLQKIASCVPGVVYQYKLRPDGTSCFPFSSEALASIYRVNPKDVIEDASSVFKNIHPDDLEEVTDTIQYSAKNLTQWQHEYRVKFDDGTVRHLFGDSIPQLEEDGSVLWHGYISDITERKLFEQKQRESDQQFRDMFEKNTAVKLVVDPESGSIINANLAAGKFYGYSIKQLENMNIDEINILDFTQIRNKMSIAIDGNSTCFYFQHRLASGEVRDVEVYSGPIQLGGRTVLNSIVHDITVRKRAEEALRLSQEELKRFASHLQHIHEEERVLLAREIHDELAQTLIALKIDMGMLKSKVLKDAENVDANDILIKFDQLFGLVNNTIKTAGSIMTGLRPEALYLLGLVEAISLYVNKFKSKYQIDCQFENSVFEHDINPQQSIALFRILQEALENVAQHAKASKVVIYLSLDKNNLVMVINDNGIGFNKCMHLKSETYGIIGMKERALFVNGIFSITAILGQGTTIKVEIPQL
ncbi:MAG: PAS domain S-box protein [Paludibacter sp.]